MRKIDEGKDNILGMAAKTINFEKIVLRKLEKRVSQIQKAYPSVNVSKYVNRIVRKVVLSDVEFWRELEKHHRKEAETCRIEKESSMNMLEVET